jgi:hypothetical protein
MAKGHEHEVVGFLETIKILRLHFCVVEGFKYDVKIYAIGLSTVLFTWAFPLKYIILNKGLGNFEVP